MILPIVLITILIWREVRHRRSHRAMIDSGKLLLDELVRERDRNDEWVNISIAQQAEIEVLKNREAA